MSYMIHERKGTSCPLPKWLIRPFEFLRVIDNETDWKGLQRRTTDYRLIRSIGHTDAPMSYLYNYRSRVWKITGSGVREITPEDSVVPPLLSIERHFPWHVNEQDDRGQLYRESNRMPLLISLTTGQIQMREMRQDSSWFVRGNSVDIGAYRNEPKTQVSRASWSRSSKVYRVVNAKCLSCFDVVAMRCVLYFVKIVPSR